jgi:Tripartite tricarboxylate transporter TctB family
VQLKNHRDLWSGLMFAAIGIIFMIFSLQYSIGTSAKMGPGYFPMVLGALLTIFGFIIAAGAFGKKAELLKLSPVGWREFLLLLASVAVFAIALPRLGMVISVALLILISAIASHEFKLKDTLISIVVLVLLAWGMFVKGLELQFPVWPKFLMN